MHPTLLPLLTARVSQLAARERVAAAVQRARERRKPVTEAWPAFHFASAEAALEAVNEIAKQARKDAA